MADALLIGLSALQAQQRSMEVTSHNIANVATPGYSRQRSDLVSPTPENTSVGQVGRGVTVEGIRRLNDAMLTEQIRKSSTEEGRLELSTTTLDAMQAVFNEPGDASLTTSVNSLFTVLQQLSNNPESVGIRAAAVEQIATFTHLINGMGDSLASLREDLAGQLAIETKVINGLTKQIASANVEIRRQTSLGNSPNDLLDQRERLIDELSGHLDVRVRIDPNDQVATIEAGGRMVVGATSSVDIAVGSSQDRICLLFGDTGGTLNALSGRTGAILELHGTTLPSVIGQLDQVAVAFAAEMNAVHSVGVNATNRIDRFVSTNVIATDQTGVNLDSATQALGANGGAGIPGAFLPDFTDENGVSQARDLTINVVDNATGVSTKYIVRYSPGIGPVPATRSLDDLIAAINTGSGGGFSIHPPQAGIPSLTASALAVDGGVRLELRADPGHSLDFSRSLDSRPSSEPWNSAWTGSSADLKGRYTGSLAYDPARQWRMSVVSGGSIGDPTAPPVISVDWYEDVQGSPVARTTTTTLGPGFAVGKPLAIGDGVYLSFNGPTLTTGESLDLMVDGAPDQARLLGALGINGLFQGSSARTLAVDQAIRTDPSRLAVGNTRVAGDNSNVLALIGVRNRAVMPGGASTDSYLASMVSGIGAQVDLNKRLGSNQDALRQALENRRDQISGVSIDEEVGHLIVQQQAYTAAARVITTAQENIRTLLDLIG
jgi:flagellar hook-associated protein 1 FlgK